MNPTRTIKISLALLALTLGGCSKWHKKEEIVWIGHPYVFVNDKAHGALTHVEFGVQDGGTVVWRYAK